MNTRACISLLLAALPCAVVAQVPAAPVSAPAAGTEARAPLTLQGKGPYFRLALPAALYGRTADGGLGGLRVLNAAGQPVPYAWQDAGVAGEAAPRTFSQKVPIFPLPVPDGGAATDDNTAVLALRQRTDGSLVLAAPAAQRAPAAAQWIIDASQVPGTLLQARFQVAPGTQGVFGFRLEGSDDLRSWRALGGEQQLLSLVHEGQAIERLSVELEGARARFLRLRWSDPRQAATLLAVDIDSVQRTAAVPQQEWSGTLQASHCDAGYCDYTLPRGLPAQSLRIDLAGTNTLVPLRVSGLLDAAPPAPLLPRVPHNPLYALRHHPLRALPGEPREVPLLDTVAYRLMQDGRELRSPVLALDGAVYPQLRLRVQGAGGSWGTAPPALAVASLPRMLVFLASGSGPFQLAWPTAAAVDHAPRPGAALPLSTLVPQALQGAPLAAGTASVLLVDAPAAPPAALSQGSPGTPAAATGDVPQRKFWLWGALGLGLLLLAGMAWSLFGSLGKGAADAAADKSA